MTAREQLHQLVDTLPEHELATAERVLAGLSALSDPVRVALATAPRDDEPLTAAEAERIAAGERDIENGRMVTDAQVRTHLGL